jgi:hypothetical protein
MSLHAFFRTITFFVQISMPVATHGHDPSSSLIYKGKHAQIKNNYFCYTKNHD